MHYGEREGRKLTREQSLVVVPWVPEIFLACDEELRQPQADTSSAFGQKVSGTQGMVLKSVEAK